MLTLSKVMEKDFKMPYDKSIKAKVVCEGDAVSYRNAQGETKQSKTVALADKATTLKAVCYEPKFFSKLSLNTAVKVRNVIKRDGTLILTSTSKVFPVGPFDVPAARREEGEVLVHPPPAAVVPLSQAVTSPPRSKTSVRGKVVQDEEEKEVMVKDTPTKIRNIFLEDESMKKVKVCLWRTTNSDIRTGDHVQVTDVVINNFRNEISLNTTYTTTVTKLEQPTTTTIVTVVGASVQEDKTELLLEDDSVKVVPSSILQDSLPLGTTDTEMYFADMGRCSIKVIAKGADIISLELLHQHL